MIIYICDIDRLYRQLNINKIHLSKQIITTKTFN